MALPADSVAISIRDVEDVRRTLAAVAWRLRWPRVAGRPRANLDAVCDLLGVKVVRLDLGVTVAAVAIGTNLIGVNNAHFPLPPGERRSNRAERFVLAHELGHVVLHRRLIEVPEGAEEWAADWFARELLAPRGLIDSGRHGSIHQLCDRFDARSTDVVLQLAALGAAEPLQMVNGRVLCAVCGDRWFLAECACQRVRGFQNGTTT